MQLSAATHCCCGFPNQGAWGRGRSAHAPTRCALQRELRHQDCALSHARRNGDREGAADYEFEQRDCSAHEIPSVARTSAFAGVQIGAVHDTNMARALNDGDNRHARRTACIRAT